MALGGVTSTSQTSGLAGSNLQDFLQIMVTQLQHQDPGDPVSNTEFVAQLAQFASLEQTQAMSDNIASLLGVQSASQSIGLMGRNVNAITDQQAFSGSVVGLDFRGAEPLLTIKSTGGQTFSNIRLSQIIGLL